MVPPNLILDVFRFKVYRGPVVLYAGHAKAVLAIVSAVGLLYTKGGFSSRRHIIFR